MQKTFRSTARRPAAQRSLGGSTSAPTSTSALGHAARGESRHTRALASAPVSERTNSAAPDVPPAAVQIDVLRAVQAASGAERDTAGTSSSDSEQQSYSELKDVPRQHRIKDGAPSCAALPCSCAVLLHLCLVQHLCTRSCCAACDVKIADLLAPHTHTRTPSRPACSCIMLRPPHDARQTVARLVLPQHLHLAMQNNAEVVLPAKLMRTIGHRRCRGLCCRRVAPC